jgi:hypothetical protein
MAHSYGTATHSSDFVQPNRHIFLYLPVFVVPGHIPLPFMFIYFLILFIFFEKSFQRYRVWLFFFIHHSIVCNIYIRISEGLYVAGQAKRNSAGQPGILWSNSSVAGKPPMVQPIPPICCALRAYAAG